MFYSCKLAVLLLVSCSMSAAVTSIPTSTLTYDRTRSKLTQVLDGLTLQFRILSSQQVNIDERFLFTKDSTLLQVVESLIATIHMQKTLTELEREGSLGSVEAVATRVVLGNVIDDSCAYLTSKLSLWYDNFTCSESQLLDVEQRINLFQTVQNARNLVKDMARGQSFATSFQCDYWNSHVLRNCSIGSSGGGESSEEMGSGLSPQLHPHDLVTELEWVEENVLRAESALSNCQLCLTSS